LTTLNPHKISQSTPNSQVTIFTGTIKAPKNLLGENRQIRSSYAEVYHRGSPENGFWGFSGRGGVTLHRLQVAVFERFQNPLAKSCLMTYCRHQVILVKVERRS